MISASGTAAGCWAHPGRGKEETAPARPGRARSPSTHLWHPATHRAPDWEPAAATAPAKTAARTHCRRPRALGPCAEPMKPAAVSQAFDRTLLRCTKAPGRGVAISRPAVRSRTPRRKGVTAGGQAGTAPPDPPPPRPPHRHRGSSTPWEKKGTGLTREGKGQGCRRCPSTGGRASQAEESEGRGCVGGGVRPQPPANGQEVWSSCGNYTHNALVCGRCRNKRVGQTSIRLGQQLQETACQGKGRANAP